MGRGGSVWDAVLVAMEGVEASVVSVEALAEQESVQGVALGGGCSSRCTALLRLV
jgi:hypothetical protein